MLLFALCLPNFIYDTFEEFGIDFIDPQTRESTDRGIYYGIKCTHNSRISNNRDAFAGDSAPSLASNNACINGAG